MGARAKLATNLVLGLNRAVLAEGFVFAERLGITPATFLELVLATPARSEAALAKGEQMVRGDFDAPQSRIRQHLKDVELMLAGAEAAGQRLPLSEAHAALLRAAVAAGDGELDNAAIVRQLRREKR
ncbi:MAG: NAD-binding protein [Rubrivivax sp.]